MRSSLGDLGGTRLKWWFRRALMVVIVVTGLIVIGQWPVRTRYGVNFQWSSKRIPLYEKTINFFSRDLQARRLVREVTDGALNDQEKALKVFSWVVRNVRPAPEGFPIVDDHVMHIIIRGYGAADQRTEAFALLASYAGFPATAVELKEPDRAESLIIALAQVGDITAVFDINNEVTFQNELRDLVDIRELTREPERFARAADPRIVHGLGYERYFLTIRNLQPSFSRMEAQKPWPRLAMELSRLLGRGAD